MPESWGSPRWRSRPVPNPDCLNCCMARPGDSFGASAPSALWGCGILAMAMHAAILMLGSDSSSVALSTEGESVEVALVASIEAGPTEPSAPAEKPPEKETPEEPEKKEEPPPPQQDPPLPTPQKPAEIEEPTPPKPPERNPPLPLPPEKHSPPALAQLEVRRQPDPREPCREPRAQPGCAPFFLIRPAPPIRPRRGPRRRKALW